MKPILLILILLYLHPVFGWSQTGKITKKQWLENRYRDSLGVTKETADSIVSIEEASMDTAYRVLSAYNRYKATGQGTPVDASKFKQAMADGQAKIKSMLTNRQSQEWKRLQRNKFGEYDRKGQSLIYTFLNRPAGALRDDFVDYLLVTGGVADTLVSYCHDYSHKIDAIIARSPDLKSMRPEFRQADTLLNNRVKDVLTEAQYWKWLSAVGKNCFCP
jgi:hypothetical protein